MTDTKKLSGLFSNTAFYITAAVLQSGVNFLLIPFYTRLMTTAEFGAMDQMIQFISLLTLLSGLGLPLGIARGLYLEGNTPLQRRDLVGSFFVYSAIFTVAAAAILFLLQPWVAPMVFGREYRPEWYSLCIGVFAVSALAALPIIILRMFHQAMQSTLWSLGIFILNSTGAIVFVIILKKGLTGLLAAYAIGFGIIVTAQILFGRLGPYSRPNFGFSRLKPVFAAGLPLLPTTAARIILESANRFIMPHFHGLSELAILTLASKIAGIIITLLLVPFGAAILPFIYSRAKEPDSPVVFGRLTYYMAILLCFLFLSIEAFKYQILAVLGGPRYTAAGPVVTVVMAGVVLSGMQNVVAAGVHIAKKLPQESVIMIVSSLISIGANFLLIPGYKSIGAAASVAIGYLCFLVGTFFLAQRYFPVRYPWRKLLRVFSCAAICLVLLLLIHNLAAKCAVVAAFGAQIILFDRPLVREFRAFVQQVVKRKGSAGDAAAGLPGEG